MFPCLSGQSASSTMGSVEDDSHCLSFAQMLRDGKARADAGTKMGLKKDMQLALPVPDSEGESDASDRVPVPSFQNSFSQAFEEALQQMDRGPDGAAAQPVVILDDKGGKKKKKKQKILFSTSLVHTK